MECKSFVLHGQWPFISYADPLQVVYNSCWCRNIFGYAAWFGVFSIQLKAWKTPQKKYYRKNHKESIKVFPLSHALSVSFSVFEIETANCRQVFACNLAVVTLETGIMKSRLAAVPAKICPSIGYEPRILIAKIPEKRKRRKKIKWRTMRMQSAKWQSAKFIAKSELP